MLRARACNEERGRRGTGIDTGGCRVSLAGVCKCSDAQGEECAI